MQDLNRSALEFAKGVLSDNGCFLCKMWDGQETAGMLNFPSENTETILALIVKHNSICHTNWFFDPSYTEFLYGL